MTNVPITFGFKFDTNRQAFRFFKAHRQRYEDVSYTAHACGSRDCGCIVHSVAVHRVVGVADVEETIADMRERFADELRLRYFTGHIYRLPNGDEVRRDYPEYTGERDALDLPDGTVEEDDDEPLGAP